MLESTSSSGAVSPLAFQVWGPPVGVVPFLGLRAWHCSVAYCSHSPLEPLGHPLCSVSGGSAVCAAHAVACAMVKRRLRSIFFIAHRVSGDVSCSLFALSPLPFSLFLRLVQWSSDRIFIVMYRWSLSDSSQSSTFQSFILHAADVEAHVRSTMDSPCQRMHVLFDLSLISLRSSSAAHATTTSPLG